MVYFTVRCDIQPGKEDELDQFLRGDAKSFWLSQAGVRSFHVYSDKLTGWPERTIMIEVEDLASLQRILESEERMRVRKTFMGYSSSVQSQIQDMLI